MTYRRRPTINPEILVPSAEIQPSKPFQKIKKYAPGFRLPARHIGQTGGLMFCSRHYIYDNSTDARTAAQKIHKRWLKWHAWWQETMIKNLAAAKQTKVDLTGKSPEERDAIILEMMAKTPQDTAG